MEKTTTMGVHIPKIWQILKRFAKKDFIKHKLLISEECFLEVCSVYYCV